MGLNDSVEWDILHQNLRKRWNFDLGKALGESGSVLRGGLPKTKFLCCDYKIDDCNATLQSSIAELVQGQPEHKSNSKTILFLSLAHFVLKGKSREMLFVNDIFDTYLEVIVSLTTRQKSPLN